MENIADLVEKTSLSGARRGAIQFCINVAYDHGRAHGMNLRKGIDFRNLYAQFGYWYGGVDLIVGQIQEPYRSTEEHMPQGGYTKTRLFYRDWENSPKYYKSYVQDAYIYIDAIQAILHGIRIDNVFDFCASGFCDDPCPCICNVVGNKTICASCYDRFLLPPPTPSAMDNAKSSQEDDEKSDRKKERAKLNSALRWQMLMRDEFKCRSCGRSPMANKEIVLHVDHIIPISRGGKTIPENLQTLCSDCNHGKSDQYDEQIRLAFSRNDFQSPPVS